MGLTTVQRYCAACDQSIGIRGVVYQRRAIYYDGTF